MMRERPTPLGTMDSTTVKEVNSVVAGRSPGVKEMNAMQAAAATNSTGEIRTDFMGVFLNVVMYALCKPKYDAEALCTGKFRNKWIGTGVFEYVWHFAAVLRRVYLACNQVADENYTQRACKARCSTSGSWTLNGCACSCTQQGRFEE